MKDMAIEAIQQLEKVALFDSIPKSQAYNILGRMESKVRDSYPDILGKDLDIPIEEKNKRYEMLSAERKVRLNRLDRSQARDSKMRLEQESYRHRRGIETGLDESRFNFNFEEKPRMTAKAFSSLQKRNEWLDPLRLNKKSILGTAAAGVAGLGAYKALQPKSTALQQGLGVLKRNKGILALTLGGIGAGAVIQNNR
jgi:hypothetical protein